MSRSTLAMSTSSAFIRVEQLLGQRLLRGNLPVLVAARMPTARQRGSCQHARRSHAYLRLCFPERARTRGGSSSSARRPALAGAGSEVALRVARPAALVSLPPVGSVWAGAISPASTVPGLHLERQRRAIHSKRNRQTLGDRRGLHAAAVHEDAVGALQVAEGPDAVLERACHVLSADVGVVRRGRRSRGPGRCGRAP